MNVRMAPTQNFEEKLVGGVIGLQPIRCEVPPITLFDELLKQCKTAHNSFHIVFGITEAIFYLSASQMCARRFQHHANFESRFLRVLCIFSLRFCS